MQKLVEQFGILENRILEMLEKYNNLHYNYNKLVKTNKLLEERIRIEKGKTEIINKSNRVQIYKKRPEPTSETLQMFITEIDDCLKILKLLR